MHFPRHFFLDDMQKLETLLVEFISNLSLKTFLQAGNGHKGPGGAGSAR
ncbi:hypothetical protein [Sphingobium sp. UBA5915]|nr:hypothetical protein [Sphingobium sp. UBA5915]